MKITITGRHFRNLEEVRELIEKKLNNAFKVFPNSIKNVRVIISKNLYLYSIEALIELTLKKKVVPIVCEHKDLRTAIDLFTAKSSLQMQRVKGKLISKKRTTTATIRKEN